MKKKIKYLFLLLFAGIVVATFILLFGDNAVTYKKFVCERPMISTLIKITAEISSDSPYFIETEYKKLCEKSFSEISRLELVFSEYREDTEVSLVNRAAFERPVKMEEELWELFILSGKIFRLTEGTFDISFKPLGELWEWNKLKELPSKEAVDEAKGKVGFDKLIVNPEDHSVKFSVKGMRLGFGGIAKGYIVKKVSELLRKEGLQNFIFDGGGDLFVSGQKQDGPWIVGILDPKDQTRTRFTNYLAVKDKAVITSGDYERFAMIKGKKYHHIIDPRTGYPAESGCISATLIGDDINLTTGLSKGLFILGPEKGIKLVESLSNLEALVYDKEMKVYMTSGFSKYLVHE